MSDAESELYGFLANVFLDVFGREIVPTPALKAADVPGWDSFAQISIIVATEERYGIEFTTRELEGLSDVGAYVKTVLAKTGASSTEA